MLRKSTIIAGGCQILVVVARLLWLPDSCCGARVIGGRVRGSSATNERLIDLVWSMSSYRFAKAAQLYV